MAWKVAVPPTPEEADQKVTSNLVADEAIASLDDPAFTSGRFFLYAHFMDPHRDYLKHRGIDRMLDVDQFQRQGWPRVTALSGRGGGPPVVGSRRAFTSTKTSLPSSSATRSNSPSGQR
jgi:hypothetical protein